MIKLITASLAIAVFFLSVSPLYSDIVALKEGTILVGKIISEDNSTVVFTNAYGTFKIKRIYIISLYRTQVYTEDIEILKRLGVAVNEEGLIKHLEAGRKKKDELPASSGKEKPVDIWTDGIISISGSFNYVTGKLSDRLTYGWSGHIAYDQGMGMLTGKRNAAVPGLRFDAGYLFFSKGSYRISGYFTGLGFIWAIPSVSDKNGYFVLAATPGISFLSIENSDAGTSAGSNTFSGSAIAGYRYPLGKVSFFVHARYIYIYDKSVPVHTIGGEIGIGYNLW